MLNYSIQQNIIRERSHSADDELVKKECLKEIELKKICRVILENQIKCCVVLKSCHFRVQKVTGNYRFVDDRVLFGEKKL